MFPGIQQVDHPNEPLRIMPDSVKGLKVALKMTGGVGDVLMTLGGSAYTLRDEAPKEIVAVARTHQHLLLENVVGIDRCIGVQEFNRLDIQSSFDVVINFAYVFNASIELRRRDYYELVSERACRQVGPAKFTFDWQPPGVGRVAIHPEASSPNRRWINERWAELAYELVSRGCEVMWLGTRDEFGFSDKAIQKLSDENTDLLWQAGALAKVDYFIGCDSGFAHVAGLLGVPGSVLFGNTHPDDVIAKYPALAGVHSIQNYDAPSRSLRAGCKRSEDAMERITVKDVVDSTPFADAKTITVRQERTGPERLRLAVVGSALSSLGTELQAWFEVRHLMTMPHDVTVYDAVVCSKAGQTALMISGRVVSVRTDAEDIRRAIRELLER